MTVATATAADQLKARVLAALRKQDVMDKIVKVDRSSLAVLIELAPSRDLDYQLDTVALCLHAEGITANRSTPRRNVLTVRVPR